MQEKRFNVDAQLRDDERRLVAHQTADEMHVAAESIELGHDDRRALAALLGGAQRRGELRSPVKRVGALARLDLAEGLQQVITFRLGEARERGGLRLKAKTGLTLTSCRNAGVGNGVLHDFRFALNTATNVGVSTTEQR